MANNDILNILMVASEAVPFAKTGGLADVVSSLSKELKQLGHDVRLVMPLYGVIERDALGLKKTNLNMHIPIGRDKVKAEVWKGMMGDVPVWFVGNDSYFKREGLYGTSIGDYPDNAERFIFFTRAVIEILKKAKFKPSVIHCHDWQTGLIPCYLKTQYVNDSFFEDTATLFTIHNLAYHGLFPPEIMELAGISSEEFIPSRLEYYGQMSFIKGGLVYADALSTVSESYAREIETWEFGWGLEGVLSERSHDLYGILNGIDYSIWDPSTDSNLPATYSPENLNGKKKCRQVLEKKAGFDRLKQDEPIIGMVSRLASQKGFDLVEETMPELAQFGIRLVILGTGNNEYHESLSGLQAQYPDRISLTISHNSEYAHLIYAGSDMFLMPSRYEPCGLGQLIAHKYGTIPVVHYTGGLADTIGEVSASAKRGNGFVFKKFEPESMVRTVKRAVRMYHDKEKWTRLMKRVMHEDNSARISAIKYVRLYRKI